MSVNLSVYSISRAHQGLQPAEREGHGRVRAVAAAAVPVVRARAKPREAAHDVPRRVVSREAAAAVVEVWYAAQPAEGRLEARQVEEGVVVHLERA